MSGGVLKKNFRKYFEWAERAFFESEWNVSVTLYFKALVEICDWFLWEKSRIVSSGHVDRFGLLKKYAPELYKISSPMFEIYRDTYSKEVSEKTAKVMGENVKKAINVSGIEKD